LVSMPLILTLSCLEMAKSIPCNCGFSRLVAFFHSFSRHYRTSTRDRACPAALYC
jgi:hypothetical protein